MLAIPSHSFFHFVGVDPNQKYDQLFYCPNDTFVQDSVVLSLAMILFTYEVMTALNSLGTSEHHSS